MDKEWILYTPVQDPSLSTSSKNSGIHSDYDRSEVQQSKADRTVWWLMTHHHVLGRKRCSFKVGCERFGAEAGRTCLRQSKASERIGSAVKEDIAISGIIELKLI